MLKFIIYFFIIIFQFSFGGYKQVNFNKIINKNGKIFVENSEIPFTGMVYFHKDREYYKRGIPNGKWLTFYKNGKLKSIENWKNGVLNGKYIIYNNRGYKTLETFYSNGQEHGIYKLFHKNGVPHIIGKFYRGKAINVWNYYNQRGNLIGTHNYDILTTHFKEID